MLYVCWYLSISITIFLAVFLLELRTFRKDLSTLVATYNGKIKVEQEREALYIKQQELEGQSINDVMEDFYA